MKIFNKISKLFVLLMVLITGACTKIINIDLNSASPKVVIEGEVNTAYFPRVYLSTTVNFSDSVYFKGLSGAFITVADNNAGIIDTLKQTAVAGVYDGHKIIGMSGHSYSMLVKANGQTYTAISTMPDQVYLDSAYAINFGGFGGKKNLVLVPKFTQPLTGKHYYRFNFSTNYVLDNSYFLSNNIGSEGKVSTRPLGGRGGAATVKPGDHVDLFMRCIDEPVYNYFNSLSQNTNAQSATPANPISNISNGALGYFSANTIFVYSFNVK